MIANPGGLRSEAAWKRATRAALKLLPGGQNLQLDIARQGIEFRLNRGGAELGSEAKVMMLPIPTHYHFDRPFLIAMRKRGAANPFFLMWIDNREVLK